ncbi:hypothetical protein F4811DRAFT_544858 [Daldinia bambusicola]|nr:hypothetical protein F4811DRAFT_544858 [Daldinia bambusicola]
MLPPSLCKLDFYHFPSILGMYAKCARMYYYSLPMATLALLCEENVIFVDSKRHCVSYPPSPHVDLTRGFSPGHPQLSRVSKRTPIPAWQ